MNGVFVDTVGLLALWNKSDQWHSDAKKAFARIAENEPLLTTRFVLLECGNALREHLSGMRSNEFARSLKRRKRSFRPRNKIGQMRGKPIIEEKMQMPESWIKPPLL